MTSPSWQLSRNFTFSEQMLPQPTNLVVDDILHTAAGVSWEMQDTGPKYYPVVYYDIIYKLSHSEEDVENELRTTGTSICCYLFSWFPVAANNACYTHKYRHNSTAIDSKQWGTRNLAVDRPNIVTFSTLVAQLFSVVILTQCLFGWGHPAEKRDWNDQVSSLLDLAQKRFN